VIVPEGVDLDCYIQEGRFSCSVGEPIRVEAMFSRGAALHLHETPLIADQHIAELDKEGAILHATVDNTVEEEAVDDEPRPPRSCRYHVSRSAALVIRQETRLVFTLAMAASRPRNRPSTPAKHPFDLPDGLQRQPARAKANIMGVEHGGISRCSEVPAAPPSVICSGLLVKDVTGSACDAGDQLLSPLDLQICPEIPQQTRHRRTDVLHDMERIVSSRVEVGFPGGNRLPDIQQRL